MYDTHFSTFASSNGQENSFQGTLSHNAFDELKQQHLQYQRTCEEHQGHHQRYDEHRLDSSDSSSFTNSSPTMPPTTILTSDAGIPLEDVDYLKKTSKVRLI
jgi:hypothetical protein